MRRTLLLPLSLGLVVAIAVVGGAPSTHAVATVSDPAHSGNYTVAGTVIDSFTSLPLAGAQVGTNLGPSTVTNQTGAFNLTVPCAPSVVLKVTAVGHHRDNLNVRLGQNLTGIQVSLVPFMFRLEGAVIDVQNSQPIAGAVVRFTPGTANTTTSSGGQFSVDLPNGTFELTVTASGYPTLHDSVSMNGTNATEYLLMSPTGSGNSTTNGSSIGGGPGSFFANFARSLSTWVGMLVVASVVGAAFAVGVFGFRHRRRRERHAAADAEISLYTIPARESELEKVTEEGAAGETYDSRSARRRYRAFWRRLL